MEHVPRPTGTFSSAFALPTTSCAALSSCLKEKSLRDMLTPPFVQKPRNYLRKAEQVRLWLQEFLATGKFSLSNFFSTPTLRRAALSSCLKEKSLRDIFTPPFVPNRLCALIVRKKFRRVLTSRVNRRKIFCALFLIAEPNVLAVAADFAAVDGRLMLPRHVPFHSALRTFPIRKISRCQTCHGENYCRDQRDRRQKFFHVITSASHNPWRIQDPP